ncbi:MAG: rhodanese-like domain-containing protein [Anaeromyxobacteraceae bacterium]|jgi:rhodanese-related sulfurtransferase
MAFSQEDLRANREYFAAKLRAERQKADVIKQVKKEPGAPDFVLVDTRARDAYAQGHIPGALCVPLAELAALAPKLPKDRELVAYCWNHT